MSRSKRKRIQSLSESARLQLALAQRRPNPLDKLQQAIRVRTKPTLHQMLEAETKKPQHFDTKGQLEKRGVALRLLKEELPKKVEARIMREKHDRYSDYVVLSQRGRRHLRQLRFFGMKHLASNYFEMPREEKEMKTLNTHRNRVIQILDGRAPTKEIFEAMIPLFENLRKRVLIRKTRAERILYLIEKKVKVPNVMNRLDNVYRFLVREQKKYAAIAQKYQRKLDWLDRMAGRTEKGQAVSGAAENFIREIHDNLQDYNVTE